MIVNQEGSGLWAKALSPRRHGGHGERLGKKRNSPNEGQGREAKRLMPDLLQVLIPAPKSLSFKCVMRHYNTISKIISYL